MHPFFFFQKLAKKKIQSETNVSGLTLKEYNANYGNYVSKKIDTIKNSKVTEKQKEGATNIFNDM
jgi:hypothetical protein